MAQFPKPKMAWRKLRAGPLVGSAFANRMGTTAINIRRMFDSGARRAAIFAIGIGLAGASWVSTFLIGSHLSLLTRVQSMFLGAYSALGLKGLANGNLWTGLGHLTITSIHRAGTRQSIIPHGNPNIRVQLQATCIQLPRLTTLSGPIHCNFLNCRSVQLMDARRREKSLN